MGREGKTLVQFGSLKVIPNLYSSKSLSDRWQVAPDTFSWQEDTLTQLPFCSAHSWPHPSQTGQVPIPQEFAAAAWSVLCPSRPLQYLRKWGRALCKHCHSLCDHWAFHSHFIQVRVYRANCVFYFACLLNCLIFLTDLAIFLRLSRLLL